MTMTQTLVDALKRDWTTPLDALNKAGCLSLSQRAGEMIRAGYQVEKQRVKLPNGKSVMSYRIVG